MEQIEEKSNVWSMGVGNWAESREKFDHDLITLNEILKESIKIPFPKRQRPKIDFFSSKLWIFNL